MKNTLIVSNVQHVCFHDGPGVRTTIFLKGCSLKCPWCANPEASFCNKQYVVNDNCEMKNEKCAYGIDCYGKLSTEDILENNYNNCPVAAIEKLYDELTIEELYNVIVDDMFLYGNEGGVTFSGGEPLLQSDNLLELLKKIKEKNINVAIETCLYVNNKKIESIINYIDLFIVDIKILSSSKSLEYINGNYELFLDNVKSLFERKKNIIFRIPLIKPYITNEENLKLIFDFLNRYKPLKVEIFKGHNLAKEKYKKLDIDYQDVETISDEEILKIKKEIEKLNVKVEIIQF